MDPRQRWIVMLGTSPGTLGGVAAAIRGYERVGLFARWSVIHLATHSDGGRGRKFAQAAGCVLRFIPLLVRRRVSVVHVHSASDASFWRKSMFIVMAFMARRPVIFQLHGGGFVDFYRQRCGPLRRWWIRFILDHVAQIVVLSEVWLGRIGAITCNPNVCVIPNPIEADALLSIDLRNRPRQTILLMGRLEREKGIFDLIEAMALLRQRYPQVRLLLAGAGDADGLRRRAAECGLLDAIDFTGWVSGTAKMTAWTRAGIYALPSYIENLPMTVLEAMAAGMPIVASRIGGIPDAVVHEGNGLLVEPGDVTALVVALDRLLTDPGFADRLAQASRVRFESRYGPRIIVPKLEAIYTRLGARPRADERIRTTHDAIVANGRASGENRPVGDVPPATIEDPRLRSHCPARE